MVRDMVEEFAVSPGLREKEVEFLPAQISRACRQIYIEADPITWKTNKFSFADAEDFKHFMHERTIAPKVRISTLRFDIDWTYGARESLDWETHVCQLRVIGSL
jgi:hypothetical protein